MKYATLSTLLAPHWPGVTGGAVGPTGPWPLPTVGSDERVADAQVSAGGTLVIKTTTCERRLPGLPRGRADLTARHIRGSWEEKPLLECGCATLPPRFVADWRNAG